MMNRGYSGKQLRGAPRLKGKSGMNPNMERREQPSNNVPAKNVEGSGGMKGMLAGAKNAMSHTEGCCAKASGHVMGRGS